jgi:hypothetical protein
MSPDSENFEQLRHLLAVKRHEQPPPGYYHSFSREVIVRIKAGELGEEQTTVWWSWEGSWLQRVWAAFETRPVVPGAVGLVVCGFFVGGVLISENVQDSGGLAIAQPAAIATLVQPASAGAPWQHASVEYPSTAGISAPDVPRNSLFDEIQNFQAQPVSFQIPGN